MTRPRPDIVNHLQEPLAPRPEQSFGVERFKVLAGEFNEPQPKEIKEGRGDQDRGIQNKETGQTIVADGMGSTEGGEAAKIVVDFMSEYTTRDVLDGLTVVEAASRIRATVELAGSELESSNIDGGSGTTLAAVLPFKDDLGVMRAAIVGIGDAVVFRVRAGGIERLTKEETAAAELHETTGTYNPNHPNPRLRPNVITNGLLANGGLARNLQEHNVLVEEILPGDRFIVTSDGIEKSYTDPENYPKIPKEFTDIASSKSHSAQQVADKLGKLPDTKGDDKLIFVTDFNPVKPQRTRSKGGSGSTKRRIADRSAQASSGSAPNLGDSPDMPSRLDHDLPSLPIDADIWDDFDDLDLDPLDNGANTDPLNVIPFPGDIDNTPPYPTPAVPAPTARPLNPAISPTAAPRYGRSPSPTPPRITEQELSDLRSELARGQSKKTWSMSWILKRGQREDFKELRGDYAEAAAAFINQTVSEELFANDAEKAARISELTKAETAELLNLRLASERTRYGQVVEVMNEKLYGDTPEKRTFKRRAIVGGAIGASVLGISIIAPPLAVTAGVAVRAMRAGMNGPAMGMTSKDSEKRILEKRHNKYFEKLSEIDNDVPRSVLEASEILSYLEKSDRRDTVRKAGSMALNITAAAGAYNLVSGGGITGLFSKGGSETNMPRGGGSTEVAPTPADRQLAQFTETLENDPAAAERFERFISSAEEIKLKTGLEGKALNDRIADTLSLAKMQSDYIEQSVVERGITRAEAAREFGNSFKNMVNTHHFLEQVEKIQQNTGLTGEALNQRISNTLALADMRDTYIAEKSGMNLNDISFADRQKYGGEFDDKFKRYIQAVSR